jgi:RimJ/RimL family protein N-acetyltransferase
MAFRHQGEPPDTDGMLTVQPSAAAPGLLLRPWTEQDVPAMVAAYRDPVMRHWLRHPVTNPEEARRVIRARSADRRAGTGFSFAVLEAHADGAAGDLVGSVSIRGLASEAAGGEVSYWITAPSRGRGIAPRALSAVCEWAFRLPRPDRSTTATAPGVPQRRAPAHQTGREATGDRTNAITRSTARRNPRRQSSQWQTRAAWRDVRDMLAHTTARFGL